MSNKKKGFSLFNKSHSSGKRSLQSLLDNTEKKNDQSRKSPYNRSKTFSRNNTRNIDTTKKVAGKIQSTPKKFDFRSKMDIINENKPKQLIFQKQSRSLKNLSPKNNKLEPTKFRDKIIDPVNRNILTEEIKPKISKKEKQMLEFRKYIKKIEGNDSWDLFEDPNITKFVLGNSVIEFRNLTQEQFKFYQSVVQMTNNSIDEDMRKQSINRKKSDPNLRFEQNVLDRLWRNPNIPFDSWDYVIDIIAEMNYDYSKFIKEYIEINSEESQMTNQLRNIKKKLKKIFQLEIKLKEGKNLNSDQLASIKKKSHYLLKKSIYEAWLKWDES